MAPEGLAPQGADLPVRYCFDDVVVDTGAHTLNRGGEDCAIEPKAFAVLLQLLRHAGDMVSKEDLLDAVWGHRHVTPGVLTRAIAQLRSTLDDDAHNPRYIHTHHALGYRFIGELQGQVEDDGPVHVPVETAAVDALPAVPAQPDPVLAPAQAPVSRKRWRIGRRAGFALAGVALLGIVALAMWLPRWLPGSRPGVAEASVAVMPFNSLSDDRRDSYFAEGLAVEMQGALAGVPGLKVAALLPAGSTAGSSASEVGQRLGVATVLDASVRREGERLRIDARLVDTRNGFILWSETYDRDTADIFATQSEIAHEVLLALLGVLPAEVPAMERRLHPTSQLAAYDPYLRGLNLLQGTASLPELEQASSEFRAALANDPRFARAQAGLCRAGIREFQLTRDVALYDRAQATCLQAARMDPGLGEVNLALGDLHAARGELDAAHKAYTAALDDVALRPSAYIGLGRIAGGQGEDALAMDYFERARQLRPGSAAILREIGFQHYMKGRLPDAIASYRIATRLVPDDAGLWSSLGGLYLANGERESAAGAFEQSLTIEPGFAALSNLGTLRYEQGDYAQAAELYTSASELNPGDYRMVGNIADALAADAGADSTPRARATYARAADMAERYVAIRSDDAEAKAWLAWYRANLDDAGAARRWLGEARALGTADAEVAFLSALVLARLDDVDGSRQALDEARHLDVAEARIQAAPLLRRMTGGTEVVSQGGT